MNNILINVNKKTRKVEIEDYSIGNDSENLQGNIVISFLDEYVEGQARLEYKIDGNTRRTDFMQKIDQSYVIPIKSAMTKEGQIDMQLVITEGIDENEIPIFKSDIFTLLCGSSLNNQLDKPKEYDNWLEVANTKLNRVDNLDITAVKEANKSIVTVTRQDKSQQVVEILDGEKGDKGDTYELTHDDKVEIGNIASSNAESTFNKYYVGKVNDFDINSQNKTDLFDNNAKDKTNDFNSNAALRKKDYNENDIDKTIKFNDNARDKTDIFNANSVSKTNKFDVNVQNKTNEFDENSVQKTKTFNDNALLETEKFNTNAIQKTNDYNANAKEKLDNFNANVQDYDKAIDDLQNQITANNDELNNLVGEVSDVKQQQGLFKQEQTLQNKAIQKNVDDIIATNKGVVKNTARIQNIEGTLYDNGVAQGEFIHLKDSALAEQQSVELGVNKAQITTTGANKFNIYAKYNEGEEISLNGITVHYNNDDSITINGVASTITEIYLAGEFSETGKVVLEPPNMYIKGVHTSGSVSTSVNITCNQVLQNGSIIYGNTLKLTNEEEMIMPISLYPDLNYIDAIRLFIKEGTNLTNYRVKFMFSNENVPYEPYTGGIASPNPDYKQEINKITGSVEYTSTGKNLLNPDIDTMEIGQISIDTGQNTANATRIRLKGYKKIDNKNYYLSRNYIASVYCLFYDKNKKYLGNILVSNRNTGGMFRPLQNSVYARWYIIPSDITADEALIEDMQLEVGDKATPYEPYQAISNTIDLKGNEVLPGDKISLRFNPMTGKYEKILKKNMGKYILTGNESWVFNNLKYMQRIAAVLPVSSQTFKYAQIYLNRFIGVAGYNEIVYEAMLHNNGTLYLNFPLNTFNTINEAKQWLKENPTEIVYELADEFKTEINLGEIDIMNMTYYPTTNAFTDKENVLINMKYYRDFTNTIRNLQIDKNTLQAQLQDIESRVKALESRPAALNEPIESEVQNA